MERTFEELANCQHLFLYLLQLIGCSKDAWGTSPASKLFW
jgi:hypothetical protein